jgi:lysophospholipase L1-like esterase
MRAARGFAQFTVLALCAIWGVAAFADNPLEGAVLAFEAQDKTNPPPVGAVVVAGSSTIALWSSITADLSPLTIISRGLGGSTADDLDYYLERIVLVYKPRAVVLYEGDNDIALGKTPQYVANRIAGIMGRITARYPNTRVYVISIKPSVARWGLWPQMTQANQLLASFCNTDVRYTFIDISAVLLGSNGQPKPEYYVTGGLHLSTAGYQAWTSVIRPVLIAQQAIPVPTDFTAPTMPTGLQATAGAPNRVDMYWNASSDYGSGLGGYGIYRNATLIATSTTPNFSDYSVAPNSFYTYAVNAFDRAASGPNQSVQSFSVGVTTPVDATPRPTITLTANPLTVTTGQSSQLSWSSTNARSCSATGGWSGNKGTSGTATSAALSTNTTFQLSCTGPGGNATATISVVVTPPLPTVTLTASPASVVKGSTAQLAWSSTNATSCTATGGWSGSKGTSGTATSAALSANTTFQLSCSGAGGNAAASAQVVVTEPLPTVTLAASPASVVRGSTVQLSWSSTDATSCTATGGWSGSKSTAGTATTAALSANTTFQLSCSGAGGNAAASAQVVVTEPPPLPTLTLSASPGSVVSGSTVQLSWNSTNATSCTATGGWSGSKSTGGTATTAALSANTIFQLSCSGEGGSVSATAQVLVTEPPPPPPTVTLSASPGSVVSGSTVQLAWSSANASSCTATGGWSGNKASSGAAATESLSANTTFQLNCGGPGGNATATAQVIVTEPPPLPTLTLSASPGSVVRGSTTQLSWSSANAASCTATGGWSGAKESSGTETSPALLNPVTFTLACQGAGGTVTRAIDVAVTPPVPIVTISATPASVTAGGRSQLSWTTKDADTCEATGGWTGAKSLAGDEQTAALSGAASFGLKCTGGGGSSSATVTVTVSTAPTSLEPVTVTASSSGGGGGTSSLELMALLVLSIALCNRRFRKPLIQASTSRMD